jgi:hypothetical protein
MYNTIYHIILYYWIGFFLLLFVTLKLAVCYIHPVSTQTLTQSVKRVGFVLPIIPPQYLGQRLGSVDPEK